VIINHKFLPRKKNKKQKKQSWENINLPKQRVQKRCCSVSTCSQLKEKSRKIFSEHAGQWLSCVVGVAILSNLIPRVLFPGFGGCILSPWN